MSSYINLFAGNAGVELTKFKYNEKEVSFASSKNKPTMVNATEMARPFGKLVGDWLRLKSTSEYVDEYSTDMQIPISALIQSVKGGNAEQGTWMHEDIALEFARWLSPKYGRWCNDRIKELLINGSVSLTTPQTFAQALRLAAEQAELIEEQQKQLALAQPKADYFDDLVDRNLLTNLRDTAKELHIKQNTFVGWLIEKGYVYRDKNNKLKPHAQYTPSLFELKECKSDTNGWVGTQLLVTPRGRETFRLMLQRVN